VTLILAILLSPGLHDWYSTTISQLAFHPKGHGRHDNGWITSGGLALTGMLIAPFAGYIGRRFHSAAREVARLGTGCFRAGAFGCLFSGVLAYRVDSTVPGLHTLLARFCAVALSLAMFSFWFCAARAGVGLARANVRARWLFICWTVLIVVGSAAALLSAIDSGRHHTPAGLYEWLASAAAYLFLLAAAVLLPDGQADIAELVKAGRTIDAIKLYRRVHGADLKTAKDAIDKMHAQQGDGQSRTER
jgi:uncharacterized protein DUF998